MIKTCFLATIFTLIFLSHVMADELKPYKVYLKEGSVLTSLKENIDQRLTRGIYAFVLETNPSKRDNFIVYDKNMKPAFTTTALGVVEIENDVAILPNVDAEIQYPAPTVFKTPDKVAFFNTQFNMHFDLIAADTFNLLYGTNFTSALGKRFEIRTLYNSDLPVNFGVSLNYLTASWLNDDDEMNLSALSFGPHLQHYLYEEKEMAISLLFGTDYSPNYRTSSGEFNDNYHAVILNLGVEAIWQTYFGKWSGGLHLRRHDLSLINTTRSTLSPLPEDLKIYSIGAMLGYKYEWDL